MFSEKNNGGMSSEILIFIYWRTCCRLSSEFDVLCVNSTDEMDDVKIDINDVTIPYGREEEGVENAIQENMIEADTVISDRN